MNSQALYFFCPFQRGDSTYRSPSQEFLDKAVHRDWLFVHLKCCLVTPLHVAPLYRLAIHQTIHRHCEALRAVAIPLPLIVIARGTSPEQSLKTTSRCLL